MSNFFCCNLVFKSDYEMTNYVFDLTWALDFVFYQRFTVKTFDLFCSILWSPTLNQKKIVTVVNSYYGFLFFFYLLGLIGPLKAATGLKFYFIFFLNHWLDKKPSITKIITTIDPSHKPVKNNLNQWISVTTQKTDYDFQIKEI